MDAAAAPPRASAAAVGVDDLDSLLPGMIFTERIVDHFFSTQFASILQSEGAAAKLENCLVFAPGMLFELRQLLLPSPGAAQAQPAQQHPSALERFCQANDLLSRQFLLLPLVDAAHASLLIVCHLGAQPAPALGGAHSDGSSGAPCILHLDSQSKTGRSHQPNFPALRALLQRVARQQGLPACELTDTNLPAVVASVPQQRSEGSGAAYMCTSALYFVANLPPVVDPAAVNQLAGYRTHHRDLFEGTPHCYPGFLTRDWYPDNVPESLRRRILEGLEGLVQQQVEQEQLGNADASTLQARARAVLEKLRAASKRPFVMPEKRRQKQQDLKDSRRQKTGGGGVSMPQQASTVQREPLEAAAVAAAGAAASAVRLAAGAPPPAEAVAGVPPAPAAAATAAPPQVATTAASAAAAAAPAAPAAHQAAAQAPTTAAAAGSAAAAAPSQQEAHAAAGGGAGPEGASGAAGPAAPAGGAAPLAASSTQHPPHTEQAEMPVEIGSGGEGGSLPEAGGRSRQRRAASAPRASQVSLVDSEEDDTVSGGDGDSGWEEGSLPGTSSDTDSDFDPSKDSDDDEKHNPFHPRRRRLRLKSAVVHGISAAAPTLAQPKEGLRVPRKSAPRHGLPTAAPTLAQAKEGRWLPGKSAPRHGLPSAAPTVAQAKEGLRVPRKSAVAHGLPAAAPTLAQPKEAAASTPHMQAGAAAQPQVSAAAAATAVPKAAGAGAGARGAASGPTARGVRRLATGDKRARICIASEKYYLGRYASAAAAAQAEDLVALWKLGPSAADAKGRLNFPLAHYSESLLAAVAGCSADIKALEALAKQRYGAPSSSQRGEQSACYSPRGATRVSASSAPAGGAKPAASNAGTQAVAEDRHAEQAGSPAAVREVPLDGSPADRGHAAKKQRLSLPGGPGGATLFDGDAGKQPHPQPAGTASGAVAAAAEGPGPKEAQQAPQGGHEDQQQQQQLQQPADEAATAQVGRHQMEGSAARSREAGQGIQVGAGIANEPFAVAKASQQHAQQGPHQEAQQEALALMAAAEAADEKQRQEQQLEALYDALELMGAEPSLHRKYMKFYLSLDAIQRSMEFSSIYFRLQEANAKQELERYVRQRLGCV